MELTFTQKKSIRKNFGKLKESLSIPNLIEVQKNSYKQFIESKSDKVKGSALDKGLMCRTLFYRLVALRELSGVQLQQR